MSTLRIVSFASRVKSFIRASSSSSSSSQPQPTPPTPSTPQSPNYPTNQRPRPAPQSGPRFEQTFMELQPNPLSAMELISKEPVRIAHGRNAVCDGGETSVSLSLYHFEKRFQAAVPWVIPRYSSTWFVFVCNVQVYMRCVESRHFIYRTNRDPIHAGQSCLSSFILFACSDAYSFGFFQK
jgi:NADH dehydrogenase (ubiquinone) Fe-S protein 6